MKRIQILTSPRTGSTLLQTALENHPQGINGGERGQVWAENIEYTIGKWFPWDGYKKEDIDFCIFLYRQDTKAQIKSWREAAITGRWFNGIDPITCPMPEDPEDFIKEAERQFKPLADVMICYEDMVNNWDQTISTILSMADWEQQELPMTATKTQHNFEIWEHFGATNCYDQLPLETIGPTTDHVKVSGEWLEYCLSRDQYELPSSNARELYNADNHSDYWLNGLQEVQSIIQQTPHAIARVLDLGGASGRLSRHFCYQHKIETWLCDLNNRHIRWVNEFLPGIITFQNTGYPTLPVESNYFDLVVAASIFTHVDILDTAWVAEIRRILRPGGTAYITVHTEHTWSNMKEDFVVYKYIKDHPDFDSEKLKQPMPERVTFRSAKHTSYATHNFYHSNYIKKHWGRLLRVRVEKRHPFNQDVVWCTK